MDSFIAILEKIQEFVWGPVMLVLLVGTGVLLTARLFGMQVWMLPFALKQAFWPHKKEHKMHHEKGDISHFGALMTALSATIGTGNIAGVATAVVLGGPGAIFWMWVSAFFGMATKFAEGVLAVRYRVTNEKGDMSGGPMYYLERGFPHKKAGRVLGMLFAIFAVIASFGIGSSVQANSVAEAVAHSFQVEPWITGVVITVLTALVILGGIKGIATASSVIVPIMAVGYVGGGLWIVFSHIDLIIPAFKTIYVEAFSPRAVVGGGIYTAIRYGVARGVFSNEAGMGSAPIAAAAAKTDHPVRQALVSMTGTFLDTLVVCTITGLVIVMGGVFETSGVEGAALTSKSFDALANGWGSYFITISLIFFAYSTILGWSYYGDKCASYLFGQKGVIPYRIIYIITVMLGAVANLQVVWKVADVFNALMAIPNLIGLIALSGVVAWEFRDFLKKRRTGELP